MSTQGHSSGGGFRIASVQGRPGPGPRALATGGWAYPGGRAGFRWEMREGGTAFSLQHPTETREASVPRLTRHALPT